MRNLSAFVGCRFIARSCSVSRAANFPKQIQTTAAFAPVELFRHFQSDAWLYREKFGQNRDGRARVYEHGLRTLGGPVKRCLTSKCTH